MDRQEKQAELARRTARILNMAFKQAYGEVGLRSAYSNDNEDKVFGCGICAVSNPFGNWDDIDGIIIDGFPGESRIWLCPYISSKGKVLYIILVWQGRTKKSRIICKNVSDAIRVTMRETMKAIAAEITCKELVSEWIYDCDHEKSVDLR
jgi:hypothetical protein